MLRVFVVAILIVSGLYGLRESGALDRTGLLGTCETVVTAADEGRRVARVSRRPLQRRT